MLFGKRALIASAAAATVLSVGALGFNISVASAEGAATKTAEKPVGATRPTAAAPAVVQLTGGKLAMFALAKNGTVQMATALPGGLFANWDNVRLPSSGVDTFKATSAPAAVSPKADEIELFVRGTDNYIHVKSYKAGTTKSGWSAWRKLEGPQVPDGGYHATSAPSVFVNGADNLELFFRGFGKHEVRHAALTRSETGWNSTWEIIPGAVQTAPSVASAKSGEIALFAIGEKNDIIWNVYKPTSAASSTRSVTATAPAGSTEVSATIEINTTKGTWSGWKSIGGIASSPPSAVSTKAGQFDVYVRGASRGIYAFHYDGKAWSKEAKYVGGLALSAPSVLYVPDAKHTAMVVIALNNAAAIKYNTATGWTGWTVASSKSFTAGDYLG